MKELLYHLVSWHWFILAGILLIVEVLLGGGFLFWIGISASLTGVIAIAFPDLNGAQETLFFAVGSLIIAIVWWAYLKSHPIHSDEPRLNRRSEQYIGRTFTLEHPIENGRGKIKVDDTLWIVVCTHDLPTGEKVKVSSVDGTLLHVTRNEKGI